MNNKRRAFLKNSLLATGALIIDNPLHAIVGTTKTMGHGKTSVTVFHTNDLHNNILPVTWNKAIGLGGLNNIKAVVEQRKTVDVLLDAGDFLDKHASFNQQVEMIRNMNNMGYHVATIGDNELAKGPEYLGLLMKYMKFKLVNCNYSFDDKELREAILPYHILKVGNYKLGITGVGVELNLHRKVSGITSAHPYDKANAIARHLRHSENCDLVICLSHLGFTNIEGNVDNLQFCTHSKDIDLIVSGHKDHLSAYPSVLKNQQKREVIVSHAGHGGLIAREITFTFNEEKIMCGLDYKNFVPGKMENDHFYDCYKNMTA